MVNIKKTIIAKIRKEAQAPKYWRGVYTVKGKKGSIVSGNTKYIAQKEAESRFGKGVVLQKIKSPETKTIAKKLIDAKLDKAIASFETDLNVVTHFRQTAAQVRRSRSRRHLRERRGY